MLFTAIFAILVGISMIGWWAVSYTTRQIPELQSEPIAIRFHLAAEFTTASALIIAGIGLLAGQNWAAWLYTMAIGMLLYTVIVSPGYMLQRGRWRAAIMFAILLVLAIICLAHVVR